MGNASSAAAYVTFPQEPSKQVFKKQNSNSSNLPLTLSHCTVFHSWFLLTFTIAIKATSHSKLKLEKKKKDVTLLERQNQNSKQVSLNPFSSHSCASRCLLNRLTNELSPSDVTCHRRTKATQPTLIEYTSGKTGQLNG